MNDPIERSVRALLNGRQCAVQVGPIWLEVLPDGVVLPAHGWKLHVSSRPSAFAALVSKLVPVLSAEGCAFKLANSRQTLADLNEGLTSPASVGKAVTIYPRPDRVTALGLALVELLEGEPGPRILSDRRIDDAAPVYYRYGPFAGDRAGDRRGRLGMFVYGPDGEAFDIAATTSYRQPPWVDDPFAGECRAKEVDDTPMLGGHYRVTSGVYESARGNVYRAIDERSGQTVVIKQARALVAESSDRMDARMRLRNERRILQAAEGIVGVPRFLDHFRHVDDEFLVTSDQGATTLAADIQENGPYRPTGHGGRSLRRLASELARILTELHARGIIMRDLAPKNVVLDGDGRIALVDFGIAGHDGVHLSGGTPGYAPERQARGEPPLETDDLYALGMTLIEAATGLAPVQMDDEELPRVRALQTVRARYGETPTGIVAAIVDLLHDDPDVARTAFGRLLGAGDTRRAVTRPPAPPVVTPSLVAELTESVLADVLDAVDVLVRPAAGVVRDASVYTGTAGIGLELLHHGGHPGVSERIRRLAELTRSAADAPGLGPGLFIGRTGIEVFLRFAHEHVGGAPHAFPELDTPPADFDLIEGSAGVGLAHLWFHQRDGDPRDLEIVRRCADVVAGLTQPEWGLAHGLAGVVEFQLALSEPSHLALAARNADALASHAEALVARAAEHRGTPLTTVSWCNGLTGMARVLLHAGRRLDRPDLIRLAMAAGDVCSSWLPRLVNIGQCCGAAGIGDLLIDLSHLEAGERFRELAFGAARQLLLRSGGSARRPLLVNASPEAGAAAWAGGLSGMLGFLRRLRDGGGPRLLPGL